MDDIIPSLVPTQILWRINQHQQHSERLTQMKILPAQLPRPDCLQVRKLEPKASYLSSRLSPA